MRITHPHDHDSIFEIMMDRLEGLAHDDFSDRRLLRHVPDEIEMQRTLAMRLRSQAKGTYQVAREEEVADQKRTDIRLSTMSGGHKAVVLDACC